MRLTTHFVFQPKWTGHIHESGYETFKKNRPDLNPVTLDRTRDLMDAYGRDWKAGAYETLIEGLTLPDPDDRHVFAAAIASGAAIIVTFNLKDFPAKALSPYKIRALNPDKFLCSLLNEAPEPFLAAVKAHRVALKKTHRK